VKRTQTFPAAVLAAIACTSALAGTAVGGPTAHGSRATKVQLGHSSLGKILVDARGFTLYRFTKDPPKRNTCVTSSGCTLTWPALTTGAAPTAGPGVKASLLSSIKLPNGSKQVTYAGHPLYRYATASERAETVYVGASQFGGIWYAVNASGGVVK
jgi:predicted lipoprotein with Yx(FWY)xxD motif